MYYLTLTILFTASIAAAEFDIQSAIDDAKSGDTVIIPAGVYTEPLVIRKAVILTGQDAILKVTANRPAIQIDTSKAVTLKQLEIQHKTTAKVEKSDLPFAVYTSGGDLLMQDCTVKALGNSEQSPCAVLATEKSVLTLRNCDFNGFNYTVQIADGSEGTVEDCVFLNPGHCGITVIGNGASGTFSRNIVTGSGYHGIRCTAGKITAGGNLIVKNRNRGFYIGNRSSLGRIFNNLIVDNATGINVYSHSRMQIDNNVIAGCGYAGLAIQDTAKIAAEGNIIAGNERGAVGFTSEKGKEPRVKLGGENLFFRNNTEAEDIALSVETLRADPSFADPDNGHFTTKQDVGLTEPAALQTLWEKWEMAIRRRP